MKVRALYDGYDLTAGKIYEVDMEYNSVYELKCDTGTYCRPKGFFEVVEEVEEPVMPKITDFECDDFKAYCRWGGPAMTFGPNGPIMCEGAYCQEAFEAMVADMRATAEAERCNS